MAHPKLHLFRRPRSLNLRVQGLLAILFALGSLSGKAQSPAPAEDPRALGLGKFLVASRDLQDPGFAQTVILIVQYDQAGTIGLAINRRTTIPISKALSEIGPAAGHSDPVYVGGPVETSVVRSLIRRDVRKRPPAEQAQHVLNDIYMIWQRAALDKELSAHEPASAFRVYLGYCGWAKGQLENEVRSGAWHVLDAGASGSRINPKLNVFDPAPETIWKRAIAQTEQQLARR